MNVTVKQLALNLMTEDCYQEFFIKLNFFNLLCVKSLISKCLGLAIIAGSSIVKVPQILKIWNNHSAQGISLLSVFTDLYAITVASSYSFIKGFPLSAYGEGILLGIQTSTIATQVIYYNVSGLFSGISLLAYMGICFCTASGFVPVDVLWQLQASTLPILLFGKLAQAYANYKNKSTGQLSSVTCTMLLFGSLSRIFTSIQETGDFIIILTYILASLGNAIIVSQFIYYRKPEAKAKSGKGKQKQEKKKQK